MKRVLVLTSLLLLGLIFSQFLPLFFGRSPVWFIEVSQFVTMILLAYIMIGVGREFEIENGHISRYMIDYGVAATAAAFPWIFCTIYFLAFLMPEASSTTRPPWIEAMLAARFAAPTSAGILFSMLAAAELSNSWAFRKIRVLAIFDDLDTILFMLPLKIIMVGFVWQLGIDLAVMFFLILLGTHFYRKVDLPKTWNWILMYSLLITSISEIIYFYTKDPSSLIGAHIEVLLPAFLLGCSLKSAPSEGVERSGPDIHRANADERVSLLISSSFMFFVGLSMPSAIGDQSIIKINMSISELVCHVMMVTIISNLGKMFPIFFYKNEASLRERLAVCVAMFSRGEVGAGVLAVSLAYGIKGPFVAVGFLSLALNLVLSGIFIYIVKKLLITNRSY